MTKWDYIRMISAACTTPDGNLLLALMDSAGTTNLRDVTLNQARRFAITAGLA